MLSWHPTGEDVAASDYIAVARAAMSTGAIDVLRGRHLHHHFSPHIHDFLAIGVIDAGAASVRYRGANSTAKAGALVTISAGETHTGAPVGDAGWSYRMLYPQSAVLRIALDDDIPADETLLFASPFIADSQVRDLFDRTYDSLTTDDCSLASEERAIELFRTLALRHSSRVRRRQRASRAPRAALMARDYLEAHFSEKIQLSTLSAICEMSAFSLIRVFRREFGLPPHAYLKQIRLARAMSMLQRGALVSRVAHSCGFSDQSHLTRNFKSTFGVTPGAYKRAVDAAHR